MKQSTLARMLAVPAVVALAALGLGSVAHAANKPAKKVKAKEFTCEEFLTLGTEVQPHVVYWLEGVTQSGKLEDAEFDVDEMERPVAVLVTECHKAPKATLLEKIKEYF
jgi:acid stress chaperone HdeA